MTPSPRHHRPSWAPVPPFVLKLLMGDMSEMVLSGQCVIPEKLIHAGYQFKYVAVDKALGAIFKPS